MVNSWIIGICYFIVIWFINFCVLLTMIRDEARGQWGITERWLFCKYFTLFTFFLSRECSFISLVLRYMIFCNINCVVQFIGNWDDAIVMSSPNTNFSGSYFVYPDPLGSKFIDVSTVDAGRVQPISTGSIPCTATNWVQQNGSTDPLSLV